MLIIPAIDLKDGKCVRLKQGAMDKVTVFSDDPVAMAQQWLKLGARRLHVIDLNGAAAGRPKMNRRSGQLPPQWAASCRFSWAAASATSTPSSS